MNTADAVAVGSDCPNDNWQASYDYTTGQVEIVDGETICEPKQSAFQISCSPTGIQVDVNYGLLYDTYDAETIASSLAFDPPRFGNCRGQLEQQSGSRVITQVQPDSSKSSLLQSIQDFFFSKKSENDLLITPVESESQFDYSFSFDYDQTNEDGEFCFVSITKTELHVVTVSFRLM